MPIRVKQIGKDAESRIIEFTTGVARRRAASAAIGLEDFVTTLLDSGMTRAEVKAFLARDLAEGGRIFGPLVNDFRTMAASNIEYVANGAVKEIFTSNLGEQQLYSWELDPKVDGKHCVDCEDRNGRAPMTWMEWEQLGLPKSGATLCTTNCYCKLTPVK